VQSDGKGAYIPFLDNKIINEVGPGDELHKVIDLLREQFKNKDVDLIEDLAPLYEMVQFMQEVSLQLAFDYSRVLLKMGYPHAKDMSQLMAEATEKAKQKLWLY